MAKAMKKAMKKAAAAAPAKKAMKAKGVSFIAKGPRAKAAVFLGDKVKTTSGFKKTDLTKNKRGKIVTKKQHAAGKKAYAFLPAACCFLVTIFPRLFFVKSVFLNPLVVFTLSPRNTAAFARGPLAMKDTPF